MIMFRSPGKIFWDLLRILQRKGPDFLDEPIIKKGRAKYIYLTNYKNIRSANKYEN